VNKLIIPLLYFSLAILIFEAMNWYGTKYVSSTWITIAKYAFYTLPLQFADYVFLVWGLKLGFAQVGSDVWNLIFITTLISFLIKLGTAYGFFQKIPSRGQIVALVLIGLANLVGKLWK